MQARTDLGYPDSQSRKERVGQLNPAESPSPKTRFDCPDPSKKGTGGSIRDFRDREMYRISLRSSSLLFAQGVDRTMRCLVIISATCTFLVGKPDAGPTSCRREAQLRRRDGRDSRELAGARRPCTGGRSTRGRLFWFLPVAVSLTGMWLSAVSRIVLGRILFLGNSTSFREIYTNSWNFAVLFSLFCRVQALSSIFIPAPRSAGPKTHLCSESSQHADQLVHRVSPSVSAWRPRLRVA